MKLTINGREETVNPKDESPNLKEIIEILGHDSRLIVVEFNEVIITPQNWEGQKVKEHDRLEIVTIVGGGS